MARSKIIFAGETLLDLTGDTLDESRLLRGVTAHGPDGEALVGVCDFDVDSSGANAGAGELLEGRTAAVGGQIITGTMPSHGAVTGIITARDGQYIIPQGHHDGSGTVGIDPREQAKLIPGNIRQGVTVLGIEGRLSGFGEANSQSKTVIPARQAQTVTPDEGYDCLSRVVVEGIPYAESPNTAGGMTVAIG